jgi:hypothetical protein
LIDKPVGVNQYLNPVFDGRNTGMANIHELISSPEYLAYKFNFETENVEFGYKQQLFDFHDVNPPLS